MGWASKAAEEVQAIANDRAATQQWTMFAHDRIKAEADALWESLAERIAADGGEFDESWKYQSGLRIDRLGLTNVSVRRFLAPLQNLDFIYKPKAAVEVVWNGKLIARYGFGVDDKGSVWFTDSSGEPVTTEDISRLSFAPLIALYKRGIFL